MYTKLKEIPKEMRLIKTFIAIKAYYFANIRVLVKRKVLWPLYVIIIVL